MSPLKRFFLIEGFYFNGICTFAPVLIVPLQTEQYTIPHTTYKGRTLAVFRKNTERSSKEFIESSEKTLMQVPSNSRVIPKYVQ
jgi:hypothetical protein